jgi:hypothetical protein
MEVSKVIPINNKINVNELWEGIGGHFDSLSQIFHELIDNSVSNFKENAGLSQRTILISIDAESSNSKYVDITIEDTGSGIENIDSAFTLGDRSSQQTPLNEHGFGLKHALASANPTNDHWCVYTRTEREITNNKVIQIRSPYKLEGYSAEEVDFSAENYPSKLDNHRTGTIISFRTSFEMFKSLGKFGTKDPKGVALYLKEDLGFIYSEIIKENIADIQIVVNSEQKSYVSSVEPWIEKTILPGEGKEQVDLGLLGNEIETGKVIISYKFNVIKNRESTHDDEKIKYYQTDMKSSGVEIRLNGRMIKNNLLTEIWEDAKQHNRFNSFLVRINLISNDSNSLPATRSSKNAFKEGDPKLIGLFKWIRMHCNFPYENKNDRDEIQLFEQLKKLKDAQLNRLFENKVTIETNRRVLKNSNESIRIDLYVAYNNKVQIYLGKKGPSTAFDLYRLKLYWDACVLDNITPTEAILLSIEHNSTVHDLTALNNSSQDFENNKYNFKLLKWTDEGIDYPNSTM